MTGGGKRPDIQGLRAVAIISVLAFHLRPQLFPSGFLGVDIFFVLSGYLMACILSREAEISLKVMLNFYAKRFKRIVPLYALLLSLLFIIVPLVFFRKDVEKFLTDVVWAACFGTNILSVVEQHDYWSEVFDSNVLTHTWSLGVEIQYYLIVPTLIYLQRKFGSFEGHYLFTVAFGSLLWHICSDPNFAFNMLPCRVWQFLAGSLAFAFEPNQRNPSVKVHEKKHGGTVVYTKLSSDHAQDIEEGIEESDEGPAEPMPCEPFIVFSSMVFLVVLCLLPSSDLIGPSPCRIFSVFLTAVLLNLGSDSSLQNLLISNRLSSYIGDISYIVYLAHWPVIIIWKSYNDVEEIGIMGILACLAITSVVSIAIHHTLEQHFIKCSLSFAMMFVWILYLSMIVASLLHLPLNINDRLTTAQLAGSNENADNSTSTTEIDIREAIKWNKEETEIDYGHTRPFPECGDDPEGIKMAGGYNRHPAYQCVAKEEVVGRNVSVLVMGNSIADRAATAIYHILKGRVNTFRLFAESGCHPLLEKCEEYFDAAKSLVIKMQPSICFITITLDAPMNGPITDMATDSALRGYREFVTTFSSSCSSLVIDEPYARPDSSTVGMAERLYKRLMRGQDVTSLRADYTEYLLHLSNYYARMDQLSDIPNLTRHNTSAQLCGEDFGICWWYNRKNLHSYFTDNVHLSREGIAFLQPSYERILQKILPDETQ